MKKIVLLLAFAMLASMLVGLPYESVAGEPQEDHIVQTLNSPIEIRTLQDLDNIRNNLDGHYVLMNDIDASDAVFWNDGQGWERIGSDEAPFTGSIDGNGFEIKNLYFDDRSYHTVKIGLVAWDCAIASSNVMKLVLEEAGYSVDLVETDASPMYTGLSQGNTDVTLTAWLPKTHASYWEVYQNSLTKLNKNLENGAKMGLVVPEYTATMLNETGDAIIADLKDHGDKFDKKVIGIDAGTGINQGAKKAIDEYNFDGWELIYSSQNVMIDKLKNAVAADEHIVVTLWDPHWIFAELEGLVYLEDPELTMGEGEYIATIANTEWAEDEGNENVVKIIKNFEWGIDDINRAMLYQRDHGDVEGAQKWIDENRMRVSDWVHGADVVCYEHYAFVGVLGEGGTVDNLSITYIDERPPITRTISNLDDLQNMQNNLNDHYFLKNDIDASVTKDWNDGEGFIPIGSSEQHFTGILEGNGHTISGLYINSSSQSGALFNKISEGSYVCNLTFTDAEVLNGSGILAITNDGKIQNVSVQGEVNGGLVGGMVHINNGEISDSNADCIVTGNVVLGGLVSINNGQINRCYSDGQVILKGYVRIATAGGLVGYNTGSINNSHSNALVEKDKDSEDGFPQFFGGLVGQHNIMDESSIINNSHATGDVIAESGVSVGGLIGMMGSPRAIIIDYELRNSFSTGNVTGSEHVGGLVGYLHLCYGILNCYATGDVRGIYDVGGLVGKALFAINSIKDSYATGNVIGENNVGGLIGYGNTYEINNTYATGDVVGDYNVGGLIGDLRFKYLNNSHAEGDVLGKDNVGGMVGQSTGLVMIYVCYSEGQVKGESSVGGLIGYNNGIVERSFSYSDVVGNEIVGGLVGSNFLGDLNNTYAGGDVSGSNEVGGLVGSLSGYAYVNMSYSHGMVEGESFIGGLIGNYTGSGPVLVHDSFWDMNATGQQSSMGGIGLTTVEMRDMSILEQAGWDFDEVWRIDVGRTYPLLIGLAPYAPVITSTAPSPPLMEVFHGGHAYVYDVISDTDCIFSMDSDADFLSIDENGRISGMLEAGTYYVNVTATSTHNMSGWQNLTLTVVDVDPVANAGADKEVEQGTILEFDGSGSYDLVGITNYTWTFTYDGEEIALYGVAVNHEFDIPGTYTVTLMVKDAVGNQGIDTKQVKVYAPDSEDEDVCMSVLVILAGGMLAIPMAMARKRR